MAVAAVTEGREVAEAAILCLRRSHLRPMLFEVDGEQHLPLEGAFGKSGDLFVSDG
jgi:hypothetical protein